MSKLLMPFLNESKDFVLGFEAGQIWEQIIEGNMIDGKIFHTNNKAQIELICKSFGVNYSIIEIDNTFSRLTIKSIL